MSRPILIASPTEHDLFEMLLATEAYELVTCTSAREALEFLKTNTPKLMILDADLPEMSGIDICYRVKKIARLKHVPALVIVSAQDAEVAARLAKADKIVPKPLTGKNIRAMVAHLIHTTMIDEVPLSYMPQTAPAAL